MTVDLGRKGESGVKDLAQRIRAMRQGSGLGVRQLARKIGVSPSTISRIERGIGAPDWQTWERIEKWLTKGEGSEAPQREDYLSQLERRVRILETAVFGVKP